MYRPIREHLAALALGGTALALVGGICGWFGTDFGYHLWSAWRCARSSCLPSDASWWLRTAGALAGSVAYVGGGLLAGLPLQPATAEPSPPPTPPGWVERVAAAAAHVGLWLGLPLLAAGVLVLVGSGATPFLRRHGVAALRLQLWQLLLVPTPFLFWLTLGPTPPSRWRRCSAASATPWLARFGPSTATSARTRSTGPRALAPSLSPSTRSGASGARGGRSARSSPSPCSGSW